MKIPLSFAVSAMAAVLVLALGCRSPSYTDQGALLGGVTGAVTGAALGDKSGNAGPGAMIGGALGALTGAAIGEGVDEEVACNRALVEQQMGRRMAGVVTMNDVIAMAQANLSDDVIITHIRANGVAQRPRVEELIMLRNQGISDEVIKAMQQTPPPAPPVAPVTIGPRVIVEEGPPVIVEEHYIGPSYPWHWRPGPRVIHRHYGARPGFRWGLSFGN